MISEATRPSATTTRRTWATASYADPSDSAPIELSALGAHVERCNGSRGRWFALQCATDSLRAFMASRLVTTALVVTLILGIVSLTV